MIVYFMQKWPDGSPTHFKEKILSGLYKQLFDVVDGKGIGQFQPKLHTMRESFRIRKGMMLDLAYWSGKPYNSSPDRFVQQTPCKNTQIVKIHHGMGHRTVIVDGKILTPKKTEQLAINDGFESVDKFFEHFNKSAEYNLIHWTNLKY